MRLFNTCMIRKGWVPNNNGSNNNNSKSLLILIVLMVSIEIITTIKIDFLTVKWQDLSRFLLTVIVGAILSKSNYGKRRFTLLIRKLWAKQQHSLTAIFIYFVVRAHFLPVEVRTVVLGLILLVSASNYCHIRMSYGEHYSNRDVSEQK